MANGVIIPSIKSNNGNTNVSGLTYTQRGNTVSVEYFYLDFSNYPTATEITGLPKPTEYVAHYALNSSSYAVSGYISYDINNSKWVISKAGSGGRSYGSFTYLTDE